MDITNKESEERKMIDVRENLKTSESVKPSFVRIQKVDADAAYQRLKITRQFLKEYREAVNSTNTVDVVGEHKQTYEQIERNLNLICIQ